LSSAGERRLFSRTRATSGFGMVHTARPHLPAGPTEPSAISPMRPVEISGECLFVSGHRRAHRPLDDRLPAALRVCQHRQAVPDRGRADIGRKLSTSLGRFGGRRPISYAATSAIVTGRDACHFYRHRAVKCRPTRRRWSRSLADRRSAASPTRESASFSRVPASARARSPTARNSPHFWIIGFLSFELSQSVDAAQREVLRDASLLLAPTVRTCWDFIRARSCTVMALMDEPKRRAGSARPVPSSAGVSVVPCARAPSPACRTCAG